MFTKRIIPLFIRLGAFASDHPELSAREGLASFLEHHPDDSTLIACLVAGMDRYGVASAPFETAVIMCNDLIFVWGILGGLVQEGLVEGPPSVTTEMLQHFQRLQQSGYRISRSAILIALSLSDVARDDIESISELVAHYAELRDESDESHENAQDGR